MNIRIESNFKFSVSSMHYLPNGELSIVLSKDEELERSRYEYVACLGNGEAEEHPSISLLDYIHDYVETSNTKSKTKESYMLMYNHLEAYGDSTIDKVTTAYLQDFIQYLQSQGLKPGSVRLYFQKLACVLHDAYKIRGGNVNYNHIYFVGND